MIRRGTRVGDSIGEGGERMKEDAEMEEERDEEK